jgi:hypothetical protein
LEQQNFSAIEKNQLLAEDLVLERKTSAILRNELDSVNAQGGTSGFETSRLESMLQRYEQRVFDLEELEVELREKISALRFAFQTLYWFWTYIIMSSGCILPSRPMITSQHNRDDNDNTLKSKVYVHQVIKKDDLRLVMKLNNVNYLIYSMIL